MLRRRLVLSSSSDEENDQHLPRTLSSDIPNSPSSRLSPNPNPNPNYNPDDSHNHFSDIPLEISDDEDEIFVDVSDGLSPPRPGNYGDCPVSEFLRGLGLRPRIDWLASCLRGLERSVPGFGGLDAGLRAKLCFEKFLVSDMSLSGDGVLPENLDELHLVDLPGPFVLQIDEIVNISCALKSRYQKAPPGIKRCLKLSMTDGIRRVYGMEYRPIKDLDALAPAGLKVVICNVHVRHGLLMLVPEAFEALGGFVKELEAARQRLVEEVNKPPRGIRTRNHVAPPLRDRATLAAWIPNSDNAAGETNGTVPEYTTPFQVRPQGATHVLGNATGQWVEEEEFPGSVSAESAIRNPSSNDVRMNVEERLFHSGEERGVPNPPEDVFMGSAEATDDPMVGEYDESHMYTVTDRTNAIPNSSSDRVVETNMDTITSSTENRVSYSSMVNIPNDEEVTNCIINPSPYNVLNDDELLEAEYPLILSGNREVPFTYVASLSAKWAATKERRNSVQGMIKCFLTGVKTFQFKNQPTYDLKVYVDDGSLVSEVLIHHNVVEKYLGYPPRVATAAVHSSDTISENMKEKLKQFQKHLENFEGKMLVEMNKTHPLPVVLEMSQGCPASDAALLLRRVKSSIQARRQSSASIDPICLSP